MKTYLHVVAHRYHLLLDATVVHEVVSEGLTSGGGAHIEWRGRILPVIDTRRLLNGTHEVPEATVAVVYGLDHAGESPLFLKVDAVCGLRRLDEGHFFYLPPVPAQTAALFDRVHLDTNTGTGLYRCRSDLRPGLGLSAAHVLPGHAENTDDNDNDNDHQSRAIATVSG